MMHTIAPSSSLRKPSSEMDDALQRYLHLSGQQDSLRRRLSTDIPPPPTRLTTHGSNLPSSSFSFSSSPYHSGSSSPVSPVSPTTSAFPLPAAAFGPSQFAPSHTAAITAADPSDTLSDDALYDINQAVKATLTELLNRAEVKHDERLRSWVQGRLMDTQLELRRQRRRRSSASDGAGSICLGASPRTHSGEAVD